MVMRLLKNKSIRIAFIGLITLLNLAQGSQIQFCSELFSQESHGIAQFTKYPLPVLVAHGKNQSFFVESTWRNLRNSVIASQNLPLVLEMDLQLTKDHQFIVMHDPTFHRLSRDYETSQETINAFWLEIANNPALYEKALEAERKGPYFFNLFDGARNYTLAEINKKFSIYDSRANKSMALITLEEILKAISTPYQFQIPDFIEIQEGVSIKVKSEIIYSQFSTVVYFDLKAINHLSRRYLELPDWDWIKNAMGLKELEDFTESVIRRYSQLIKKYQLYHSTFITARHPRVYQLIKNIDSELQVMVSTEKLTSHSDFQAFKSAFAPYLENHSLQKAPLLVEVKYLNHILNPEIRSWALNQNLRLFYNQIKETDQNQFDGIYKNNLPKLIDDILQFGDQIWIQTNSVKALSDYLERKKAKLGSLSD